MIGTKVRLQSALKRNEELKTNYLTATNSRKLIEAIWAVNNKPLPPSSSVLKFKTELRNIPDDKWFNKLFNGQDSDRTKNMMAIIEWILPLLKTTV